MANRGARRLVTRVLCRAGGVAEWPIAPVLKTGNAQAFEGSNPSPSALMIEAGGRIRDDP